MWFFLIQIKEKVQKAELEKRSKVILNTIHQLIVNFLI